MFHESRIMQIVDYSVKFSNVHIVSAFFLRYPMTLLQKIEHPQNQVPDFPGLGHGPNFQLPTFASASISGYPGYPVINTTNPKSCDTNVSSILKKFKTIAQKSVSVSVN